MWRIELRNLVARCELIVQHGRLWKDYDDWVRDWEIEEGLGLSEEEWLEQHWWANRSLHNPSQNSTSLQQIQQPLLSHSNSPFNFTPFT